MNEAHLVESQDTILTLDSIQVAELRRLSVELAGRTSWWGRDDSEPLQRQVIQVAHEVGDLHRVRVLDAVGVLSITGLNLFVHPKIPLTHFSYIFSWTLPVSLRTSNQDMGLESGRNFLDLVARWFLTEVGFICNQGLHRDYIESEDSLTYLRGSVNIPRTFRNVALGTLRIETRLDEYCENIWVNKIIARALKSPVLQGLEGEANQRDLARALRHFREIQPVQGEVSLPSGVVPPARYANAVRLAQSLIENRGRDLYAGTESAKTFLVRTPPLVEFGLRALLSEKLAPIAVRRGYKLLVPSSLSANPDLELSSRPLTADIKYKISSSSWNRHDLAQAVFFASAYRSDRAAVISFAESSGLLPNVPVGDIEVCSLTWDISQGAEPEQSAQRLVDSAIDWILGHQTSRSEEAQNQDFSRALRPSSET